MTSKALGRIRAAGGPRCCKRASYLSILFAVDFVLSAVVFISSGMSVVAVNNSNS